MRSERAELGGVVMFGAGVGGKVRRIVELLRIDEQRDDDTIRLR